MFWLFHTDTTTLDGERVWLRASTNGVTFGAPILVSQNGASLSSNSDFAYDEVNDRIYAAIPHGSRYISGTRTDRIDFAEFQFGLYRGDASAITSNSNATWTHLATVDTIQSGYILNYGAGLVRNAFGLVGSDISTYGLRLVFGAGHNYVSSDLISMTWRPAPQTIQLTRYYNGLTQDFWVSTGYVLPGYVFNLALGSLYTSATGDAATPLYACQIRSADLTTAYDNFVTSGPAAEQCEAQFQVGLLGYAFSQSGAGRIALHRCRNPSTGHHYVTTDSSCEGVGQYESLLGYSIQ